MTEEQYLKIERYLQSSEPTMKSLGVQLLISAVDSKKQWRLYWQRASIYFPTRREKRNVKYQYANAQSAHLKKKKDAKRDSREAVFAAQKCRPRDV